MSHAGLSAPRMLYQRIGVDALVAATVTMPGPCGAKTAAKVATVLAGMLAGADSIDDLDVLRAVATPKLFDDLRAPSTIGSWLRSFTFGNVRQLDAVSREVRVRLWAGGVGPPAPPGSAGCSSMWTPQSPIPTAFAKQGCPSATPRSAATTR